jgi:PBP1b-binding outer membrane lipoprotein LpoB
MKYIIVLALLLGGCATTVPVTQKFPEAPKPLLEPCQQLKPAPANVQLSELTKIVVENYMQYHICSGNNSAWIEWYTTQQRIFNKER